jgi:hypothetical protein
MKTRNCCTLRRIFTTLLTLRSGAYQATSLKSDATTTMLLKLVLRGTPGALQEGMAAPASVTASVPTIR